MVEPVSPARINFGWLIRLRFATVAGQALTIAAVRLGMNLEIPLPPLSALVALALVSNLVCIACARAWTPQDWWLLAVMALDVVVFSGLLYFTGGPENPFSFLYLVPIAIAAITLRPAWTWMLVLLSLASSLVLFARHEPLPMAGGHAGHMVLHLRGMWVAFGVASAFIVYFLLRVRRALAAREEELVASRSLAARQERLASLATLAAGAAHELATPLSTIAVVAKDLEREVVALGAPAAAADDVRLMRQEVERCRRILGRMRVDAGDPAGERFARVSVRELLDDCLGATDRAIDVAVDATTAAATTALPRHAFGQALRGLVDNARQASPPGAPVTLRVAAEGLAGGDRLVFEVADRGAGMPPDLLARVGEPFFTTKPAGQGMGLGIFLARAIVERLGGELSIRSAPGSGTTATLWLPVGSAS
ncbi:MAG TPA: ATP-binding protein [Polyangia bacterium]|jgi:two-component system sensor histidine kinase RegB|nr:ATP-binding protein [Polyangia bacterium]